MDHYIYNPPPPPPPPSASSDPRRNNNNNRNNKSKSAAGNDRQPHPYKRPETSNDGDVSSISPEVKEAARDIQQWIEQRRKNWPSNKRVVEKEKENEQRKERERERGRSAAITSTTSTAAPSHGMAQAQSICRYFARGKCRAGDNCKYLHEKPSSSVKYKRFEAPDHSSLYKKLVQTDVDHENNQILDFIMYIEKKGLLT